MKASKSILKTTISPLHPKKGPACKHKMIKLRAKMRIRKLRAIMTNVEITS